MHLRLFMTMRQPQENDTVESLRNRGQREVKNWRRSAVRLNFWLLAWLCLDDPSEKVTAFQPSFVEPPCPWHVPSSSSRGRRKSFGSRKPKRPLDSSSNSVQEPHGNEASESWPTIRLNKVFKSTHSRRQADALISSGRVTVNNGPVERAGQRVVPFQDIVKLDGRVVEGWEALNPAAAVQQRTAAHSTASSESVLEYVKYWKPTGVVCTTDRKIRGNILDRLEQIDGYRSRHRVYPVGRLDKETSGLILLTSDGRLPNAALRGQYKQPKTYVVRVNRHVTEDDMQRLRDGVVITTQAQRDNQRAPPLTQRTRPCLVEYVTGQDRRKLRMTLTEGRNRQIRKMMQALNYRVVKLHREEFMTLRLTPLQRAGDWAPLSQSEMMIVNTVLENALSVQRPIL